MARTRLSGTLEDSRCRPCVRCSRGTVAGRWPGGDAVSLTSAGAGATSSSLAPATLTLRRRWREGHSADTVEAIRRNVGSSG
jgi:hypothetical protein